MIDPKARERSRVVCDRLLGTCCESLTDEELADQEMLEELDNLTLMCEG